MQQDVLKRVICDRLNLRAYTATTLSTVRDITSRHGTSPNATVALGRTITAATLLSATLKPDSDQSLLLKIEGSGPIREIHAQADTRGNIRGYPANPVPDLDEDIGGISFSRTIGAGFLTVRKDIGLKEPYSSITPLHAGEVAEDLAYYLTASEQVPSAVIIALTLDTDGTIASSGGILIQTFPDTPDESITRVEHSITSLVKTQAPASGRRNHFGSRRDSWWRAVYRYRMRPVSPVQMLREIISAVLLNIHREELEDMIRKTMARVTCTFCTKKYHFDEEELERIVNMKKEYRGGDKPERHSLQ